MCVQSTFQLLSRLPQLEPSTALVFHDTHFSDEGTEAQRTELGPHQGCLILILSS